MISSAIGEVAAPTTPSRVSARWANAAVFRFLRQFARSRFGQVDVGQRHDHAGQEEPADSPAGGPSVHKQASEDQDEHGDEPDELADGRPHQHLGYDERPLRCVGVLEDEVVAGLEDQPRVGHLDDSARVEPCRSPPCKGPRPSPCWRCRAAGRRRWRRPGHSCPGSSRCLRGAQAPSCGPRGCFQAPPRISLTRPDSGSS